MNSGNVVWHPVAVTQEMRQKKNKLQAKVIWFTGLSGSGKSTITHAIDEKLFNQNIQSYVLDGDNIRHGLCGDLTFSETDRHENIRRIGEVAKLFLDAGLLVMAAFISPYRADRDFVKTLVGEENFIEIYCKASLATCEQRDVKGLYKKARDGIIKNYSGISSPYEVPKNPAIILNTDVLSVEESVNLVLDYLQDSKIYSVC